jgi:hypothetical protein
MVSAQADKYIVSQAIQNVKDFVKLCNINVAFTKKL